MGYAHRIKVFLLHDDPVAHAGLSTALARYPDLEILGPDVRLDPGPGRTEVDVVVADYTNGIALATPASRGVKPHGGPKILIVAASVREWEVRCALARGVLGYVVAGSAVDELVAGIRAVHLGGRHLSPKVAHNLADCLSGDPLTLRETQVLRLVVDGLSNKAIARQLDIAVGTVKSHLKGVFDKLNVESRTQAMCAAERRGLLCEEPRVSRRIEAPGGRFSDSPPSP